MDKTSAEYEISLLQLEVKKAKDEVEEWKKKCFALEKETVEKEEKIKILRKECMCFQLKVTKITDKYNEARQRAEELSRIRRYRESAFRDNMKVAVQIFCNEKNDFTVHVADALVTLLKSKPCAEFLDIKHLLGVKPSELASGTLLFILCFNQKTVDSSVQRALAGIKSTPSTAVLLIHHKEPHALPVNHSKILLSVSVRESIGAIFDLAFLQLDGFYTCDMNEQNVAEMLNFIETVGFSSIK